MYILGDVDDYIYDVAVDTFDDTNYHCTSTRMCRGYN